MATKPPTIISRKEAMALGLKRFFTGKPCKRGHIAERTVCDHSCMKCVYENTRKRRAADPETARETQRRWRAANPERARKDSRRWYAENKDRILSERAAKRAANREEAREYQRRWRAKNKDKILNERHRASPVDGYISTPDGTDCLAGTVSVFRFRSSQAVLNLRTSEREPRFVCLPQPRGCGTKRMYGFGVRLSSCGPVYAAKSLISPTLAMAAASSFGRSTMTSCPLRSLMTSHPGAPVYFFAKYRNGLGSHPSAKM
jgi:hypothetical protein